MKLYKLRYLSILAIASMLLVSCDDDDPISAGDGDPLNENVVNLDATVSTDVTITGEGNTISFSVVLPQSFASDASVTARITLDNGTSSIGTAEVLAGATSGTGSITLPPDDAAIDGNTLNGIADAAELTLVAILLDELEPGTSYTVSSNNISLGLYPDTLPAEGGLNVLLDWEDFTNNDLDFQIIDRGFTSPFETSASGSRFESDLFQNTGREDGIYDIYLSIFGNPSNVTLVDIDYIFLLTLPDSSLEVIEGTLPAGSLLSDRNFGTGTGTLNQIPSMTFEKSTDPVTGEVSYINIGSL